MKQLVITERENLVAIANAVRANSDITSEISLDGIASGINYVANYVATHTGGIDTSDATASADDILSGKTAYTDGQKITGTFSIDNELATQDNLIAQIQNAVDSLPEASGEPTLQTKTVTPTTSAQNITPDSGYDGLSKVTVNAIPSTYVKPTSTKSATTYTPTTSNQTIAAGTYCSGVQTIKGDANLKAENIAEGVSIFGVTGTHSGGSGGGGNVETCNLTISYGNSSSDNSREIGNLRYTAYENGTTLAKFFPSVVGPVTLTDVVKGSLLYTDQSYLQLTNVSSIGTGYTALYSIDGDNAVMHGYRCFVRGTKIILFNNNTKEVQDITYDDDLLVWDFDNGCYASAKPLWIKKSQVSTSYYKCEFDNGIVLKLVGSNGKCHRIFNMDTNSFESATDCVGSRIATLNGISKLIKCEKVEETVEFYNIITNYHMNLFAESVLTSCRLNNLYEIKDMKFVKEERENIAIDKYTDIDNDFYIGLRLSERKSDDINAINQYIKNLYSLMENKGGQINV